MSITKASRLKHGNVTQRKYDALTIKDKLRVRELEDSGVPYYKAVSGVYQPYLKVAVAKRKAAQHQANIDSLKRAGIYQR